MAATLYLHWSATGYSWVQRLHSYALEALYRKAAAVARSWEWSAEQITIQRLMTDELAASNRDGREQHDNYWSVIWDGIQRRAAA